MSKRQARIERKNARRLKQQEKSARLLARPRSEKAPRKRENPESIYGMKMTWDRDTSDCNDVWSWGVERQWSDEDWDGVLLPNLGHWSALTWGEIDKFSSDTGHKMHHNMDTDCICEEAQMRLIDIEQYSDVIFRFRLSNKRRLWGQRTLANFSIVWFDPTHKVYPADPD